MFPGIGINQTGPQLEERLRVQKKLDTNDVKLRKLKRKKTEEGRTTSVWRSRTELDTRDLIIIWGPV